MGIGVVCVSAPGARALLGGRLMMWQGWGGGVHSQKTKLCYQLFIQEQF